jgi:hypothetical protein
MSAAAKLSNKITVVAYFLGAGLQLCNVFCIKKSRKIYYSKSKNVDSTTHLR